MVNRQMVIERLSQLGCVVDADDYSTIDFELEKTISYVLNFCNITTVPGILDTRIVDRVCGYYLYNKKNAGCLDGFNYDTVIKSIKEGDTTLTYAVGQGEDTPENRFDSFVKSLERGFDKWLVPYRRLRW